MKQTLLDSLISLEYPIKKVINNNNKIFKRFYYEKKSN